MSSWSRLTAGALLLAGMACSSTTLVNMWRDPAQPRAPLHNILVITLRKGSASRRLWEDGFVHSLRDHGVQATPSYTLFPDAAPDTAAISGLLRQRGFDGMLVAHSEGTDTVNRWRPGYVSTEPVTYFSPWTGHYFTYWQDLYRPGYVESDQVVRYETEVWMTGGGGKLVWVGATESLNPESGAQVNHEIAKSVVPELVKQGVVRGSP